jgi:hypothetical protein
MTWKDIAFTIVACLFICSPLFVAVGMMSMLRNSAKNAAPCCEPAPADPRIDSLLLRADVIRKGHEDADVKLDAIAVGIADLVNRKQPAPVVVEKVVTVEKIVDRVVEKPVTVTTERVVHRADPAAAEAMREARRYIAQWTFVDDPEENKIRAAALKKLAKALGEAK